MSSTNFAQAQQRLAAQRQAREGEARKRVAASHDTSRAWLHVSRLPFPLNRIGSSSLSAWELVACRQGTRPSFRVGQVDAELLDEELVDLLRGQVGEALKYYQGNVKDDWSAEIHLAIRAVLFKLTIWDHDATYGAALQNLKLIDARNEGPVPRPPSAWQKALYGLLTVGGQYGWTKWEDWLLDRDNGYEPPTPWVQRLSRIRSRLTMMHSVAAFTSFLVFLVHGRYRTLLDRMLRMRLAPPTSQTSRELSFEYLNRQLVWHAFTEFLLFVLPLVGINRWRRWVSRAWRKTKELVNPGSDKQDAGNQQGEYAFLPERTCAICYQAQNTARSEAEILAASGVVGSAQTDVTNPYETMPCRCIYCYVCLATRLEGEEGEGWICLRCGELVKECKPWSGDVLEEKAKSPSPSPKRVGFADHGHHSPMRDDESRQSYHSAAEAERKVAMSRPANTDSDVYEEGEDSVKGDSSD